MTVDPQDLIKAHVAKRASLERESHLAEWELARTGDEKWEKESSRLGADIRRLLSDREVFSALSAARNTPTGHGDVDRQLDLLYLDHASNQTDPELLRKLVELEVGAEAVYGRFRPVVDGMPLTENEIRETLRDSDDVDLRQRTWCASKEIGREIAPIVMEMVTLRNQAAREAGWSDFHTMSLELQEIDSGFLFDDVFSKLEDLTEGPYDEGLSELFARLAERFGTTPDAIRPWHLADPFFQEAIPPKGTNLARFYQDQDLVQLTRDACAAMGFDVADSLKASDLFPRDGKNQHAFCAHIDRMTDDVRVLCNVVPDDNWMDTMLHEFGHAVYDLLLGRDLPWPLRQPAHTLSTEAVALLFGRFATNPDWMIRQLGASGDDVEPLRETLREYTRFKQLLFPRWVMVMVYFEREMYANPTQDLNKLWWDLVERFQKVPRPEGRNEPDWAAKIHVGLAPVYYQNYLLGDLMASQLDTWLAREMDTPFWFQNRATCDLMEQRMFRDGARYPWNEALQRTTGARLDPTHYVEQFVHVPS